jgi:hypothetical protein
MATLMLQGPQAYLARLGEFQQALVRRGCRLKRSRHSKLLDQLSEWGPDGWRSQPGSRVPSSRVPKGLLKRIEQELQRRNRPPAQPLPAAERLMRGSRVPGVTEAVSGGRLPFPSFLAMELVEAYLPDRYRRAKAPAH